MQSEHMIYAAAAVLYIVLSVMGGWMIVRSKGGPTGRVCRECSYDLTGHGPDATICPECGKSIVAAKMRMNRARRLMMWFGLALVFGSGPIVLWLFLMLR